MTRNKIISKRSLPGVVLIGTCAIISACLFTHTVKEEIMSKYDNWQDKALSISTLAFVVVLGTILLSCPIVESYKNDYKFASHSAREFLKQAMKDNPEIKDFANIFNNPKALRSVATMISNSLLPSEEKRVLTAIAEMQQYVYRTKAEEVAAAKQAHAKIVKVIQEHAAIHPDFINEVYAAMAYADNTYVVPAQQRTR